MKLRFWTILVLAMVCCALPARAQRQPKPATKPSTKTAPTADGRKVVLKPYGTWPYALDAAPATSTASLSIEAGLLFQSGDAKPIARVAFHLLDDDLGTILQSAKVPLPPTGIGSDRPASEQHVIAFGAAQAYSILPEYERLMVEAPQAMLPHFVKTVTTDFAGKAKFDDVPPGTYYLVGRTQTPRGFAVWNLKVELKVGPNSITIDQNNAVFAN